MATRCDVRRHVRWRTRRFAALPPAALVVRRSAWSPAALGAGLLAWLGATCRRALSGVMLAVMLVVGYPIVCTVLVLRACRRVKAVPAAIVRSLRDAHPERS